MTATKPTSRIITATPKLTSQPEASRSVGRSSVRPPLWTGAMGPIPPPFLKPIFQAVSRSSSIGSPTDDPQDILDVSGTAQICATEPEARKVVQVPRPDKDRMLSQLLVVRARTLCFAYISEISPVARRTLVLAACLPGAREAQRARMSRPAGWKIFCFGAGTASVTWARCSAFRPL